MFDELSNPRVWKYIADALVWGLKNRERASTPGDSLVKEILTRNERAVIIGLALGYVMRQRTGEKCVDKELAYADHYLQARLMVAYLGPPGKGLVQTVVVGYEAKKKVYEALGILDHLQSDKQCPQPVSPDSTSILWGTLGAEHGEGDFLAELKKDARACWKKLFEIGPELLQRLPRSPLLLPVRL